MFSSKSRKAQEAVEALDFSQVLSDRNGWALGQIHALGIGEELTAFTYDPVQSLLAVGTAQGKLFVFGKPGVELSWDVGLPSKVKHLAFKAGSGFLCVVDAKDTLYVYDLQRLDPHTGRPHRDSSLSLRSNVTCLESSASHSFLFIGGKDGTVDAYDIDRGVMAAQARVPNLWLAQEEILRRSGVPGAPTRRHIPVCTDLKTHPLDLNLLLIAYEGGVALFNLATRQTERNWEFVLPPGAPGGGNDVGEAVFMERRSPVTCLAWRPDGLVFAAGHEDGSISVASAEDEMPIMIRTLERADVNKTTEEDLFNTGRDPSGREPIFRLAWSGFPQETYLDRASAAFGGAVKLPSSPTIPTSPTLTEDKTDLAGGTVLTVLGGLLPSDPTGIHLLELPAYTPPPATSAPGKPGSISLAKKDALRASIAPIAHHLYPTASPPEDFLLLPRSSPHYGLSYDPSTILITSGRNPRFPVLASPHSQNNIEAFTFPPTTSRAPHPLTLPSALSFSGRDTCSAAQVINISGQSYRQLLHQYDISDETGERIPLHGGSAFPQQRPSRARGPPPTLSDQPPRLLLTSHTDLTVRFSDVSTHLLWGRKPDDSPSSAARIEREFPRPLRHLDVDLKAALADPRASELEAARLWRERPWELELDKVEYAEDQGEVAVSLSTGDVVIFRLAYGERPADLEFDRVHAEAALDDTVQDAQDALADMSLDPQRPLHQQQPGSSFPPPTSPGPRNPQPNRLHRAGSHAFGSSGRSRTGSVASPSASSFQPAQDLQDHYIDLRGAVVPRGDLDGFRPVAAFSFAASNGGAPASKTRLALSNVGFLAASSEANLLVVDLRGPEVLLLDVPGVGNGGRADKKGKGKVDASSISALTWTISPIGDDLDHSPRLLVTHDSGLTRVFELANLGGSWHLSESFTSIQHDSTRSAFASFVLDKHGNPLLARAQELELAIARQNSFAPENVDARGALTSLWVTVNRHTIACFFNIDGPKTAQYDDEHTVFEKAAIVQQQACTVLVVQSTNRMLSVFSLPELRQVARLSFEASVHDAAGTVSFSPDGDLVQHLDPLNIRLHTLRDMYRPAFPPKLHAFDPSIPIPAQTSALQAVGSVLGSWFGGAKVYSGAEIDAILGGPNRPPPKNRPAPGAPPPLVSAAARKAAGTESPTPTQTQFIQGATDATRDIMARTNAALEQRGEYLGYIQEKLSNAADEAAKFAAETKRTAQQEAFKKSIAGGFSSLWKKVP
ncbi:hypothetical protein JCM6882_002039 [Rhodosporidiobolus microsporus]